ncbi:MAG: hypothetical protein ACLGSD_01225 [Acidobacteriota bacterium]
MKLTDSIRRFSAERSGSKTDRWAATTEELRRIASPCAVCGKEDLSGHFYGEFASHIARSNSPELREFYDLYRARRWQELRRIREFEGRFNAAILYALFCPEGSCILAVRDPAELYDADELMSMTILNDQESAIIREMQVETHAL